MQDVVVLFHYAYVHVCKHRWMTMDAWMDLCTLQYAWNAACQTACATRIVISVVRHLMTMNLLDVLDRLGFLGLLGLQSSKPPSIKAS